MTAVASAVGDGATPGTTGRDPGRRAGRLAALLLLAIYGATAAHDVTFWDAGEFATAIATFGIPHPPGTPLYVALGRALHVLVPGLAPVAAGIVLSVVASAVAGGVLAALVARALGSAALGVAAAIVAGAMGSVWGNATEVEVYGVALACSAAQFALAWRAHALDDDRARAAVLTVAALAVPLHLIAVVSAPAALLLACTDREHRIRWLDWVAGSALLLAVVLASRGAIGAAAGALVGIAAALARAG
ncbi:MAG: DUF2723 domain-containing protein [Gemmatimonadaceae bacterium]|nr:DUF2723 domain-containing protein [Gemmatimonadaceae bacterium]